MHNPLYSQNVNADVIIRKLKREGCQCNIKNYEWCECNISILEGTLV